MLYGMMLSSWKCFSFSNQRSFTTPYSGLCQAEVYAELKWLICSECRLKYICLQNADQGANFWVTECSQGQEVWCEQTNSGGTIRLERDGGGILHSFVGFLIALTA